MNAQPAAQLALVELLALLVNRGIRVVATTHSPYVVDHLHNLLEAGQLPAERKAEAAALFKLKTTDAFLDWSRVAVFEFTDSGEVKSAVDAERKTIDWATFSNETDYESNLFGKLLQLKKA